MERFRKLDIKDSILKSIEEHGFEKPSEIQEKTIPLVLKGKDVIAGAATGSGKTLVFGSAIIQHSKPGYGIQALVLTPTRELAEQVSKALNKFSKYNPIKIIPVYGGVSINPQIDDLEDADVVVGTPGRVLDHLSRRTINLSTVKILVLDEADRMLDMGFKDDVERIINECPTNRQTLLFSATISQDISRLAKKYMNNPEEISAECYVDPSKLPQVFYDVDDKLKFSLLVHLLKTEKPSLAMVFCNTRKNVDFVYNNLRMNNINAVAIHGGLSQEKRTRVMESFNTGKVNILVCTDVAARGLDIKGVSHIFNYNIPADAKEYIHRIGRTARAGKEGKVINILASRDYENFRSVLKNDELKIEKKESPYVERAKMGYIPEGRGRMRSGFENRGFSGGRGRASGGSSGRSFGGGGRESRGGGRRQGYRSQSQDRDFGRDDRSSGIGSTRSFGASVENTHRRNFSGGDDESHDRGAHGRSFGGRERREGGRDRGRRSFGGDRRGRSGGSYGRREGGRDSRSRGGSSYGRRDSGDRRPSSGRARHERHSEHARRRGY